MRIYKYEIPVFPGDCFVEIPIGARIIAGSVKFQGAKLCVWAEVDRPDQFERRKFSVRLTGEDWFRPENETWSYLGTAQRETENTEIQLFVVHVYVKASQFEETRGDDDA